MSGPLGSHELMYATGGDFYEHQIANSCRFNKVQDNFGASSYMYHQNSTPTNVDKCTISCWVKRANIGSNLNGAMMFTGSGVNGGGYSFHGFGGDGATDEFYLMQDPGSVNARLESTAFFRDVGAWYHIVVAQDSTQGTAANRNKIYFNGVQYTDWGDYSTYSTQNADILMNTNGYNLFVGSGGASDGAVHLPFDGYIAEYVFIDGTQNAVSDFGETKNGVWVPKDPSGLTFGNNGVYLKFENSAALGNDSSGNNNDFTLANISAHDQMTDSPTFNSSSNGGNFPVFNRLQKTLTDAAITEGNLKLSQTGNNLGGSCTFEVPTGGKWYWEAYVVAAANQEIAVGITGPDTNLSGDGRGGSGNGTTYAISFSQYSGSNYHARKFIAGTESDADGSQGTTGNAVLGIAINRVDNEVKFYWNNENLVTNDISATAQFFPWAGQGGASGTTTNCTLNFGQDGTFAGAKTAQGNADGNGYGNFIYSPPSGHLALCSANLPSADTIDPNETDSNFPQKLFSPILYTGNAGTNNITGLGFKPDWLLIKIRNTASNAVTVDSTRGTNKVLFPTNSDAEVTSANVTAFGTDGFSLDGTSGYLANFNGNTNTYVAWAWRANGGTTSTNSTGTVNGTQQVDPSGAFSLTTYTGTGSSMTVGHGLSAEPKLTIIKDRGADVNWIAYTKVFDASLDYLFLNTTAAKGNSGLTGPNSSIWNFNAESGYSNTSSRNYVMYNFTNIEGYCKVGIYEGNGNADGTFVYTGFRPSFIVCKSGDSTSNWQVFDDERLGNNVDNNELYLNIHNAEASTDMIDILSNGFKFRISSDPNVAETYLYWAMAHNPFKYSVAR